MAVPHKKNHLYKRMGIFNSFLFTYLALHYAYAAYTENSLSGTDKLIKAIENGFADHPFYAFKFSSHYWDAGAFLIIGAGLMIDALLFSEWLKNKDQHRGKEKGTAKWNDGKKFRREYTYGVRAISWEEAGKILKKSKLKSFEVLLRPVLYYFLYIKTNYSGKLGKNPMKTMRNPAILFFPTVSDLI